MMTAKCSCQHCGQSLEFDAEYLGQAVNCPACGQPTTLESVVRQQPNQSPPKRWPIIIVGIFIGIMAMAGMGIMFHGSRTAINPISASPSRTALQVPQPPAISNESHLAASAPIEMTTNAPEPVLSQAVEPPPPVKKVFPPLTPQQMSVAQQIIRTMGQERDEVENITWFKFEHEDVPHVSLYIGKFPSGTITLRLKMYYYGDDWVFTKKFLVRVDSDLETITPKSDLDQKIITGGVVEKYDESAEANIKTILKMINSQTSIVRFEGEKEEWDYEMTKQDKVEMARTVLAFRYLGGNYDEPQ